MGFVLTANDYMNYIELAAKKIRENSDYITSLDAATGDGDHWVNINMGFEKLLEESEEIRSVPIDKAFYKIGTLMMKSIGGSSGILYGGAYMAAAKALKGEETLNCVRMCEALDAMLADMMQRGKAQPGFKTMIDALHPAVSSYKKALEEGLDEAKTMQLVKQAALSGAEKTKEMQAVKGRASYQGNKGVGHLDPGAVTMSYQIECLCDYICAQNL